MRAFIQRKLLALLPHPFNGPFSRTTWVSRYRKGKTGLDLNEARDDGILGWQWHQLDRMQTICTSLPTDNHTNTSSFIQRKVHCIKSPDALIGQDTSDQQTLRQSVIELGVSKQAIK